MKNIKRINKVICIILILTMFLTNIAIAGELNEKNETVYVNLDSTGSPREKIVVEWLRSDEDKEIKDRTILSDIVNLKSDQKPVKNGEVLTWKAEEGDIYYRGSTDKKLPLDIDISYFLDGKKKSAREIAGKSGSLEIRISVKNSDAHTVKIGGKNIKMYTPMTVVMTTALPDKTFKNVTVSDGKLISDGNNQLVTILAMPGLRESLNLDNYTISELKELEFPEEFSIFADVSDFEMGAISIAATPQLINMDKIKKSKEFEKMKKDLYDLKKVQDDVELADPDRDLRSLFTNPDRTAGARLLIDDIFNFYDMDKALLDILPDYVTDENIKLYDRVHADAKDADVGYILDNETFRGIPDRLTNENIEKSKLLVEDYDKLQTFNMEKLDRILDTLNRYDEMYPMIARSKKVYDSAKNHKKEIRTLMDLTDYSNDITNLIDEISYSGLLSSLSENEIKEILTILAKNKSAEMQSLIAANGDIAPEHRPVIINIIQTSAAAKAIDQATADDLCAAVSLGNVGKSGEMPRDAIDAILNQAVKSKTDNIEASIKAIAEEASDLDMRLRNNMGSDYMEKINKSKRYINSIMPDLRYLEKEANAYDETLDDVMDLMADKEEMEYLHKWAKDLKSMKKDLDDNNENLEILRDMLKEYEDEKVKYFKEQIPALRDDFDLVRPILESLNNRLEEPILNASLHNSPKTVEQLLKMRKDLEDNRKISEILRTAIIEKNVVIAQGIIKTLDRLQAKKAVEQNIQKMNDADELFERKEAFVKLSEDYSCFAGAAEGTKTQLKFIMKTDDIKKPEPKQIDMPQQKGKKGFFNWCKSVAKKIFG